MGAFPFVISYRAFQGLTRNPKGNRALSFPIGSELEGKERNGMAKSQSPCALQWGYIRRDKCSESYRLVKV